MQGCAGMNHAWVVAQDIMIELEDVVPLVAVAQLLMGDLPQVVAVFDRVVMSPLSGGIGCLGRFGSVMSGTFGVVSLGGMLGGRLGMMTKKRTALACCSSIFYEAEGRLGTFFKDVGAGV